MTSTTDAFMKSFVSKLMTLLIGGHYTFTWLALLHAICGQYFYVPFLVDNIELHVGKRPRNSIYSGGYTSWQEGKKRQLDYMIQTNKKFMFPRFWWGWLGRTNFDRQEIIYRKRQRRNLKRKENNKMKNFFKLFRKWILNY